jgi:hypothetical protein
MDIIKEEEDMDTISSLNKEDGIGVNRDELCVPASFTIWNSETKVNHVYTFCEREYVGWVCMCVCLCHCHVTWPKYHRAGCVLSIFSSKNVLYYIPF